LYGTVAILAKIVLESTSTGSGVEKTHIYNFTNTVLHTDSAFGTCYSFNIKKQTHFTGFYIIYLQGSGGMS
jgi:hypothetical protein